MSIILLVPPNAEGFIRDTYYGCWHKKKFINYSWPPLYLRQLNTLISNSKIFDLSKRTSEKAINILIKEKPKIIIVNIGTYTFQEDHLFLKKLKQKISCKIIAFGQHSTILPNDTLKSGVIDFAIKGEPEEIIQKVVKNINEYDKLKKINGVCLKNHISEEKAQIKNLDKVPIPKRNLEFDNKYFNPLARNLPYTSMTITRGCPYSCTFCTVPSLYGKTFRKRSINIVIKEIKQIKELGYKEIFFRDENLTLDKKYIKELCEKIIKEKIEISWIGNSRVDTVDFELLKIMKKAGCHLLKFGVESSNQNMLNLLKKGTTIKQVKQTVENCKKIGIDTLCHFMIGNPGETRKDILKTINFAIELDPRYASFDVLINYPKTNILNEKQTKISKEELNKLHNYAFRKFYLRLGYIFRHLLNTKSFTELILKIKSTIQLWKGLLVNE
ncbi:radical SAM protein [archaeon]|jgi:anaerobic magnesium-protoporphyrin IX monomethyl ester cyclase|nr:radical SAM protein [archaeon]MBT4022620.1 radical SAM protein [archaeon]MBT4272060.1 radical SAM protein [archaeon]MBT4461157.1 radical SAM protein [archaeon]MBT4858850.1 radical SAM protein [archaeon]